jgi:tape measure domain-containing protein
MALRLGSLFFDVGADTSGLKKAEDEVKKTTGRMSSAFSKLGSVIAAALSIEGARRVALMADEMQVLESRVRRLTRTQKEFNKTMGELLRISSGVGTEIRDTVGQFQRFKFASKEINASTQQVLEFTETFQQLGILAGNTGAEVGAVGVQLGQGLAKGRLDGDELRSVLEAMPEIAQLIAKELGVSVGQLRDLGAEGKITSDIVFKAILGQSEDINKQFKEMRKSLQRVGVEAKNTFALAVTEIDKMIDGTETVANFISQTVVPLIAKLPDGFILARGEIALFVDELSAGVDETMNADAAAFALGETWRKVSEFAGGAFKDFVPNLKKATVAGASEVQVFFAGVRRNAQVLRDQVKTFFKFENIGDLRDSPEVRAARQERRAQIDRDFEQVKTNARQAAEETISSIDAESKARRKAHEELMAQRRAELDARRAARGAGAGVGGEKGDTTGITAPAQVTNEAATAKMLAALGTETDQILQAYTDRNTKIMEITAEGSEERRALQIANAERLERDLEKLREASNARALASVEQALGHFNEALRAAGKEGTAIAKAAFLAQKAVQVVQIIAATETAAKLAAVSAAPGGPGAVFSTENVIRAAGYASAGLVAGLAVNEATGGGRQFGGTTSPQLAHPVNEGGTPEILTQAGKQYLMPNGKGGKVSPLESGTGSGGVNVTIISHGTPQTITGTQLTEGQIRVMIDDSAKRTKDDINTSIATGRGDTANALTSRYAVENNI